MKAVCIIFGAAVLPFGQTTAKRETAPTAKKGAAPAAPDTWERSKECAAQAEKAVAARIRHPDDWQNHYSPKYGKCFVELYYSSTSSDPKFPSLLQRLLVDAFERSTVAITCAALGHPDCVAARLQPQREITLNTASIRLNGKLFAEATGAEQEAARTLAEKMERDAPYDTSDYCGIDGKAAACKEAAGFISEHMKN